jgi:hypothetical protein
LERRTSMERAPLTSIVSCGAWENGILVSSMLTTRCEEPRYGKRRE